jgi:hypothetical protein
MNAVEIEQAVSTLAAAPFDAAEFPYAFLEAFGNKETTLRRLRSGDSNQSDLPGGVLQRNNIHLAACPAGEVAATLTALRQSPKTSAQKAKFILATDGLTFEAENLADGATIACAYPELADHFVFFLPLAGITYTTELKEMELDRKATRRLNQLYISLLKDNPEWSTAARREDLNHFMARLIFCFFAEDTGIFHGTRLFSSTIDQMTKGAPEITHEVISEIFRAMNVPVKHEGQFDNRHREAAKIKTWANAFPYVNGGLFTDSVETPRFSKIARSYLLHVGNLDWTKINPDIFGSMIQAVADDEERGALGMHYTSVPNILKVLNPLFLDELRARLAEAGDGQSAGSARKLLNLRQRIARIRVFDPACGSGNFLVIAYKELRALEAEINRRRGEADRHSEIPLTNFRGIELRHFSCEIARLALIIAEYQCDVHYRGERLALAEFLPLQKANWITCGNALRLDWLSVCPPTGKAVKVKSDELPLGEPLDQSEIDFKNEGGETYICGNPPYKGQSEQTQQQKSDLESLFTDSGIAWKNLDYVAGWFFKFCIYQRACEARAAFVTTNSICQGLHVPTLWPRVFESGVSIFFARTSFKWRNLAANNAGVTVVVVGLHSQRDLGALIFSEDGGDSPTRRQVPFIGPYLVPNSRVIVEPSRQPINGLPPMDYGSKPADGGGLVLKSAEYLSLTDSIAKRFIKPYLGSDEFIEGKLRYCVWVPSHRVDEARSSAFLRDRESIVRSFRSGSKKAQTRELAEQPFSFSEIRYGDRELDGMPLIIPIHTGEDRLYLPVGGLSRGAVVSNAAFALYDAPLWNIALIASRLHLVWIGTVCGKLETRYRYSNTLGWNTFPVPALTEQNKADLTRCAEDILLAREAHFPATIADLYDPETMPANLRAAHERNDETLERIYLGRRFKNDTERLEKLFALYTEMTARPGSASTSKPTPRRKKTNAG